MPRYDAGVSNRWGTAPATTVPIDIPPRWCGVTCRTGRTAAALSTVAPRKPPGQHIQTTGLRNPLRSRSSQGHMLGRFPSPPTIIPGTSTTMTWWDYAAALVDSDWLLTPHDVVTFFAAPWKWGDMFQIWADAGRPHPPSSSDCAQARQLGPGTMRHQLDRQYAHDKARWESLVAAFEGRIAGEELSRDSSIPPSGRIADVIALKDVAAQHRS